MSHYENMAGYTATKVAGGWAGAVMNKANKVFGIGQDKPPVKTEKKTTWDRPTDRATDDLTDIA